MKWLPLVLLQIYMVSSHAAELLKLKVEPFDFQNPDMGFHEYYLDSYDQMVIQGRTLYLRAHDEPQIVAINTDNFQGTRIGSQGEGPGELRSGAAYMAVRGSNLWAIDFGNREKILHFVEGRYKDAFAIDAMDPQIPLDGLSLAASDTEIVSPLSPRSGHLAMAYGFDGSKTPVGKLLIDKRDGELVYRLPHVNQTIWHFGDDGFWYAAFPYSPMVLKFDRKFKKVGHFSIEHPLLADRINQIMEFEPVRPNKRCIPLVTDIKWFRNKLYVMSSGYLFQLDPNSGDLHNIIRFSIYEPEHSGPGLKVFPLFAFRDDGAIFLGHPSCFDLSEHDMYHLKHPPFLAEHPDTATN